MFVVDMDEFYYFIQSLINEWCKHIKKNEEINYLSRCNDNKYGSYGFLLNSFIKIYPILNDINYNNFEWISLIIDFKNILKCFIQRIEYENLNQFKEDNYYCFNIDNDNIQKEWDNAINKIMDMLIAFNNIGIAENHLIEYLEDVLFHVTDGDTTIIPIIISMMLL